MCRLSLLAALAVGSAVTGAQAQDTAAFLGSFTGNWRGAGEARLDLKGDPTRVSFGELTNSVTVAYWDAATGKDGSLGCQDFLVDAPIVIQNCEGLLIGFLKGGVSGVAFLPQELSSTQE